jgi:hypothetical protein
MQVVMLNKSTFRVVLGCNELDTYYVQKRKTGTWIVAQKGEIFDFAPTRDKAIDLAVSIYKKVAA